MKNLYRYALIVVAMTFLGMSCVNNDYELDTLYPNTEGNSKLKVHFSVKDSELVTRAAQDVNYEYNVQSIYVFVFSGDNRVELSKDDITDTNGNINYFDLEEIEYEHNKATANDDPSTGVLTLGAVAGSNMRICLIANIGVSNSETRADITDTTISDEVEVFDDIETYTDLKKLVLKLGVNSVQRQSAFLLTGEATGVTLDPNPDEVTTVEVPLHRTDAKITFNVKAENADLQDFKFVPKTWRVMNAPATTYAIPNSEVSKDTSIGVGEYLDASDDDVDYFDSPEVSFEGKVQDNVDNSGTFTFYMYENLKGPKLEIGENGGYALREKQVKNEKKDGDVVVPGQTVINGNYEYAPELGTYVVFTGQLSYTHESTTEDGTKTYAEYVMADVEYSVHLGHNSDTDFNDYKTLRNYHYTYNVTVTGVNDLLVEVEGVDGDETKKEEKRPGVEGEVVMSSAKLIEIDGHYDRALITFTPEEADTIYFAVNTPWERGLDTNGFLNSEADSYVNDYKWIKFLINRDYQIDDDAYAPFPGEQCYDGGTTKFGTAAQSDAYNTQVILRDIRQLSNYLAKEEPTENVIVTAFIDEYLYNYNPSEDNNRVTSKDDDDTDPVSTTYKSITNTETATEKELLLWKRSVNNNARMMHIVKAGDMKYSEDGQTSLSRSVVSIYQKPILSLYNHMATNLKTAWGVETVNETPKMIVSRTDYPNSSGNDNYYTYAQKLISGNTWASVISSKDRYGLQSTYNDPSYACALRNRDFNGDGNIDQNEMQWYLAALDQMSGLWIADPIFTEKMFDPQNPDGYYPIDGITAPATHYVTSTIKNSSPMVYWAEEFGATSTHDAAIGWRQAVVPDSYVETYRNIALSTNYDNGITDAMVQNNKKEVRNNAIVAVRCVRNFGAKYTSTDLPQDYYIVTQPSGGDGTIDLTYINAAALRTAPDSGIALAYGDVNTTTENNRPYTGFFVQNESVAIYNSGGWRKAYDGEVSGTDRVCPTGYRVPNQREMILMSITLESWPNQGAYTMFNGQYLGYYNPAKFGEFYYITPNANSSWNPDRKLTVIILE